MRRNARYTVLPVDGPVPREMLRALASIRSDPLGYLADTVHRYGDLVAFPLPRTPALLVNTPSAARRVLVENHGAYSKDTVQYAGLSAVTGAGLLTSDGEVWRRSRRIAQPAFHRSGLDLVALESVSAAQDLRRTWETHGGTVDVEAASLDATLAVVTRTLFGAELAGEGSALVRAVLAALRVVVQRARTPVRAPGWMPTSGNVALTRANRMLDDACARLVTARRWSGRQEDDLLGLLLQAADAAELSDRQVRDELVTIVIAGHETVAAALTWTLWLLAEHGEAQQRLHGELDDVLAGRAPTGDDVPHLRWTRAVVDESLRLFPPAWVLSRRAARDDVLDGVPVPQGTLVIVSPWLLQRREDAFPEPEAFLPERWLEVGLDAVARSQRGEYLPFGAGPRLCIGRDVALVELVLMLAELLRDRTVASVPGTTVEVEALVTLRPRAGLPLRLAGRGPLG